MNAQEPVQILIVDDHRDNLFALEALLAPLGHRLLLAGSGCAALKILLQEEVALILLDVTMPNIDGYEVAELIRGREANHDTPIIFITANPKSAAAVFKGYSVGAVDYIFKPLNADVLRAKVSVFVELFRKREQFKRQAQELARLSRQNQLILDAASEGIFGVDHDGVATFVNPAAARMIGRPADDVIRNDVHPLLHPSIPGVSPSP